MTGVIQIRGEVGEDVKLTDVVSQVKSQPEATDFLVKIDSEGGNVDEGFYIYNYLNSLGLPIHMVGTGVVASIATVIFMAGSSREVKEGTIFMIHYPMIREITNVTSDSLDAYSVELKKYEKKLVDFYVSTTGLEKEAIEPMLFEETYLEYSDLFSLGFVTKKEPILVQAISNINKSKPKIMSAKKEKEAGAKILDIIKNFIGHGDVVGKVLLDANQGEVVFPDVADDESISVGDSATIEGEPADGNVVLADGRTITFVEGVVTEITEAEEAPVDETPQAEAIEQVNSRIDELAEIVRDLAEYAESLRSDKEKAEQERDSAVDAIAKIEKIQSRIVSGQRKTRKSNNEKDEAEVNPLSVAIQNLN